MNFRSPASTELPPRTRRILRKAGNLMVCWGTTSAYAENTQHTSVLLSCMRNYLRVRGEYRSRPPSPLVPPELPPRTRRIRLGARLRVRRSGTTSAYAENTNQGPGHGHRGGNYLRVRGEYITRVAWSCTASELPPRTRRILCACENSCENMGTTSAYAENTYYWEDYFCCCGNYLRVRGEYLFRRYWMALSRELPPRTRRIQHPSMPSGSHVGTTSAYAENTLNELGLL